MGMVVAQSPLMQPRLGLWIAIVAASGCVTGTAHQLTLAGNPLREQASACEVACRRQLRPASPASPLPCQDAFTCGEARPSVPPDDGDYARCLDSCPGATVIDGASCPDPPREGVICVKTNKANPGAIAGGTVAVASGVAAVTVIVAVASLPVWLLIILIVIH